MAAGSTEKVMRCRRACIASEYWGPVGIVGPSGWCGVGILGVSGWFPATLIGSKPVGGLCRCGGRFGGRHIVLSLSLTSDELGKDRQENPYKAEREKCDHACNHDRLPCRTGFSPFGFRLRERVPAARVLRGSASKMG